MHPVLVQLRLGDDVILRLPGYGFFVFLGVLVTSILVYMRLRRQGISFLEFSALWGFVVGFGFLGAIVAGFLFSPRDFLATFDFVHGYFSLAWQGGLVAGAVAAFWMLRNMGQPVVDTLDSMVPPVFLGLAVGRLGCLLGGCCFGCPTDLPWGIRYPIDHVTHELFGLQGLHPFPVYSAALAIAIAVLTLAFGSGKQRGWALAWSMALYSAGRFALEPVRGDHAAVSGGMTPQQWCSLLVIVAVMAWYSRSIRNRHMHELARR